MSFLRELVDDYHWRNDVAVKCGLSAIASLFALIFVDAIVPLPRWSIAIPFAFFIVAGFFEPPIEWQHAQDQEVSEA